MSRKVDEKKIRSAWGCSSLYIRRIAGRCEFSERSPPRALRNLSAPRLTFASTPPSLQYSSKASAIACAFSCSRPRPFFNIANASIRCKPLRATSSSDRVGLSDSVNLCMIASTAAAIWRCHKRQMKLRRYRRFAHEVSTRFAASCRATSKVTLSRLCRAHHPRKRVCKRTRTMTRSIPSARWLSSRESNSVTVGDVAMSMSTSMLEALFKAFLAIYSSRRTLGDFDDIGSGRPSATLLAM